MYLQRLYIGLNDKDLHKQIINTESAKQIEAYDSINEIFLVSYYQ